jgi:hypothetical protein
MNMVCRPQDELLSFRSDSAYRPWSSAPGSTPPALTKFENLALLVGKSAPKEGDLTGVLLASALPMEDLGCEVLRPLWAEEALHRAHAFLRLIDARRGSGGSNGMNPIAAGVEDFAARDLAVRFKELRCFAERAVVPCAVILQDIVTDLGALFGCPANIALKTRIDRLSLPAYKRRALVLAACELLCNALLHAFPGSKAGPLEVGRIEIGLTLCGARSACLRVADNGIGFSDTQPNLTFGVASGLAGLLEAELAYDRRAGWTYAEIFFPVSGP